jgi:D-alanyl-D-alanine carboxypeptidase
VSFAIVKASDGHPSTQPGFTHIPKYFSTCPVGPFCYITAAKQAGLIVGAYHFARPYVNSGKDEADFFYSVAHDYIGPGYLPPALDIEDPEDDAPSNQISNMSGAALSAWILDWIMELQNLTGNPNLNPMIYTTPGITRKLTAAVGQYPLWLAWYARSTDPQFGPDVDPQADGASAFGPWGYSWTFLQYNVFTGMIDGITGNVDLDMFNGDAAALANYVGGTSSDTTLPTISAFDVTPNVAAVGQPFTLTYTVADTGGSGLKRIEIRRANIDGSDLDPSWAAIGTVSLTDKGNGPFSGAFSDAQSASLTSGDYWYGLQVCDNEINCRTERQAGVGPIHVVISAASATPTRSRTNTPSETPTRTFTATFTLTNTPTKTYTSTATWTITPTLTITRTPTATYTVLPSKTPTPTSTATVELTKTPSVSPTRTDTPTPTPSFSQTPTATHTNTRTPTNTRTFTLTAAPTATATETATVTPRYTPTATLTPSPTPTETATPSATATRIPCVGDCDGLGTVTVDELVVGVNIALGNAGLDKCLSFDENGDDEVTVDELVAAVNSALNGCVPGFDKAALSVDDPASLWVVVNKRRPLNPIDYQPGDLVDVPVPYINPPQLRAAASAAVVAMFAQFQAEMGLQMQSQSAFRSYGTQVNVYNGWVEQFGQEEADRQSARPGYSEHQTGLAIDVSAVPANCALEACFADTPQGQWLAANAFKWGFVLRYPSDKTPVTGYAFEPWHYRYVGVALATEMHGTGVTTLEEFFALPAAPPYAGYRYGSRLPTAPDTNTHRATRTLTP